MSKLFDYLDEVEERRGKPIGAFEKHENVVRNLRRSREDVATLVRLVKTLAWNCAKYVYGRNAIEKAEALLPEKK